MQATAWPARPGPIFFLTGRLLPGGPPLQVTESGVRVRRAGPGHHHLPSPASARFKFLAESESVAEHRDRDRGRLAALRPGAVAAAAGSLAGPLTVEPDAARLGRSLTRSHMAAGWPPGWSQDGGGHATV